MGKERGPAIGISSQEIQNPNPALLKASNQGSYKCSVLGCSKQYTCLSHLLRHKKLRHEKFPQMLLCKSNKCGKVFSNQWSLDHHEKKHELSSEKSYSCSDCSHTFHKKKQLKSHQLTHSEKHHFRCSPCKLDFTDEEDWKKHKLVHFPYSCRCGEMYNLWSELQKHKKNCETERSCIICNKVFLKKHSLKRHRWLHDDSTKARYICGYKDCTKRYQYKKNFILHIWKCHDSNIIVSNGKIKHRKHTKKLPEVKKKSLEDKAVYKGSTSQRDKNSTLEISEESIQLDKMRSKIEHVVDVNQNNTKPSSSDCGSERQEGKKYKCMIDDCNAVFSKKRKLINHIRRHMGERPFICDIPDCTKSYTNSSHLLRHKKTCHEKKEDSFICPYENCKQLLSSKWNLTRHYKKRHDHNINQTFQCSECPMGFSKKKKLLEHQYVHTGKPAYKCDSCNIYFTGSYELSRHNRHHKTYTCTCGEVYDLWSKLLLHKKRCKLELTCTICSKTFANKSSLRQHKMIHDDVRKAEYICGHDNCDRKYQYKKNLVEHIKSRHLSKNKDARIPCTYDGCTQDFKLELYVKRHLRSQHGLRKPSKRPRKPRKDKGKPKKSMASILSGIELTPLENMVMINANPKVEITSQPQNVYNSDHSDELLNVQNTLRTVIVKVEKMEMNKQTINDQDRICSNESQGSTDTVDLCNSTDLSNVDDNMLYDYCDKTLKSIKKEVHSDLKNLVYT